MDEAARRARGGVGLGLGAYLIWGFLPLFFKALEHVMPLEIVAQRVAWSVLLLAALIVGAAMLMRVETSSTLLGYPSVAIICFLAAAGGGFALVVSIIRSDRKVANRHKKHR